MVKSDEKYEELNALLSEYLNTMRYITMKSMESFIELYKLVEKSSDKKLRKEAQRLFGTTTIELAKALHKMCEIEEKLKKARV